MDGERTRDLAALIKATDESRALLERAWKKVEALEAAIDAARHAHSSAKARQKGNKDDIRDKE